MCEKQDPCTWIQARAELRSKWFDRVLGEGTLSLSRNGGWALLTPAAMGPGPARQGRLFNLETNQEQSTPPPAVSSVASDGSLLVQPEGSLPGIWRNGTVTPIRLSGPSRLVALSDDGRMLVYQQALAPVNGAPAGRLVLRDIASGGEWIVFDSAATGKAPWFMAVSNDGKRVLYRATVDRIEGEAFVFDAERNASYPLQLKPGELAAPAGTLNGPGTMAFVATTRGRVLRFDVASSGASAGAVAIPETPYIAPRPMAPGSRARLTTGMPLSAQEAEGKIMLGERPMTVLAADSESVTVQVAWDQRTGDIPFRLAIPSDSPFMQNETAMIFPFAPRVETESPWIKADFSGFVSQPVAGEIVHMYMTGLGPVQGPIETGQPAPLESLRPLQEKLTCRFIPQTAEAETLFAGLAPGMVGIYQVSFRIPAEEVARPISGMNCEVGGSSFSFSRITLP